MSGGGLYGYDAVLTEAGDDRGACAFAVLPALDTASRVAVPFSFHLSHPADAMPLFLNPLTCIAFFHFCLMCFL